MGRMKEVFTEMHEMQILEMEYHDRYIDQEYRDLKEQYDVSEKNVGKMCVKYSDKPFKSGLKTNTIKGVVEHPVLHIPAYTFVEDDSYVECRKCKTV